LIRETSEKDIGNSHRCFLTKEGSIYACTSREAFSSKDGESERKRKRERERVKKRVAKTRKHEPLQSEG